MAKRKSTKDYLPWKSEVEEFEMLYPMLISVLDELKELSKKKQDGVLNSLKAKTINKILSRSLGLLKDQPSADFLDLLDEDVLPTNSDAVLMIVQFRTALQAFKEKYTEQDGYQKVWNTSD